MSQSRRAHPSPWPDGKDPSPDVYTVTRADGAFVIAHYRSDAALAPCCTVTVRPAAGESETDTLHRAYAPFALCTKPATRR